MRKKNIIAAAVLIVIAIIYGGFTAFLPVRTLPNTPDPSFFPWINTALILGLSICLLVQGLRQPVTDPIPGDSTRRRTVIWAMGAFVIYLAAMPTLGFILATAPFFAVMMVLFGEHRPALVSAGAICMTVVLYVLFKHGFGVFLPRGLLTGLIT